MKSTMGLLTVVMTGHVTYQICRKLQNIPQLLPHLFRAAISRLRLLCLNVAAAPLSGSKPACSKFTLLSEARFPSTPSLHAKQP